MTHGLDVDQGAGTNVNGQQGDDIAVYDKQ
jgi:hypothetical protein